jgi:hypothetical protein
MSVLGWGRSLQASDIEVVMTTVMHSEGPDSFDLSNESAQQRRT